MPLSARQRAYLLWTLIAAICAGLIAWGLRPTPRELDGVEVRRQRIDVQRVDQGYTQVRELYRINAPVAGQLQRISLEPGDAVQAGDVLARLLPASSTPLDARSAAEAEAAVEVARAQLGQAEAGYGSAQDLLERNQSLYARKLVPERELTQTRALQREAAARLAAARSALQQAQVRIGWDTAPSGQEWLLRAPVEGRVLRRLRESEGPVAAGEPLLEIGDPTQLEVVAEFLSQEAADMQPGAEAQIEAWGGAPLPATVRRIEPLGELKISALGVEERRVRILLDLAEVPPALGHGFQLDARITVQRREDALVVPLEALLRQGAGWRVWRLHDDRIESVAVEVGVSDGSAREVLGGLQVGDVVVLYPPEGLQEGERVRRRAAQ